MEIKARYDQLILKAVSDESGKVIGIEPTNHHFTFGRRGDIVSGGFYIKQGTEIPDTIVTDLTAAKKENGI